MGKKTYKDNAKYPIIAIDFDDTIYMNGYPDPYKGTIHKYAKEVINFLHDIGCKIVIWTCRENHDGHNNPLLMAERWLTENDIKYDAVNESKQFCPYDYNPRKIYAHLYVDDKNYWFADSDTLFLSIMDHVLMNIIGAPLSGLKSDDPVGFYKKYVDDWRPDL